MSEPVWRRVLRMRGPDPRADVRDEFAFHLEERTEAGIAAGLTEADARARAREQFGDIAGATAACSAIGLRRARRVRWRERLATVGQDVRYALAGMRRAPGFTTATVLTIALGIGANTVVFSLLNALVLQPLDARDAGALVRVYTSDGTVQEERERFSASSYADYVDLAGTAALEELAAFQPLGATIELRGAKWHKEARIVSANYFTLIGRPMYLGGWRAASAADGVPEVIISHRFWSTQLERDPAILGRSLTINGIAMTVAGVTDARFRGIEPNNVDVYVPFSAAPLVTGWPGVLTHRGDRSLRLLGRLARGVTASDAERDLDAMMQRMGEAYPETNAGRRVAVRAATSIIPMELVGGAARPTAALVFGATVLMLAIAGVNVAAVLLARTMRRRREFAVRLSLGASRLRLARQLATESVMLALVAGMVVSALLSLMPMLANMLGVPASLQPGVDPTVLAYTAAVALASGLLFGLGPAFAGARSDVVSALRTGELHTQPSSARAQRALVSAQLAISMVLLIVGSALLRSLHEQQRIDPGFAIENLVVAEFVSDAGRFDPGQQSVFTRLAVERLLAIPGITSVSVASMAPFNSDGMRSSIHIPGYVEGAGEGREMRPITGGPELFATLGIPMLRGRELSWNDADTSARIVVNASMARRYWGQRDPVGTFVRLGGLGGTPAEVIGVASDARFYALNEPPGPLFAVLRSRGGGTTLLVRSANGAESVMPTVRGLMTRPDIPLTMVRLRSMEQVVGASLLATRAVTGTLIAIGTLAVLLSAVGLFGVVSYITAGRGREFGVRLALGASPGSITRLVLGYGARLAFIGGVIGTVLGLLVIYLVGGLFFADGSGLAVVPVVAVGLGVVTLAACAVPAWRAMAASPATALRSE